MWLAIAWACQDEIGSAQVVQIELIDRIQKRFALHRGYYGARPCTAQKSRALFTVVPTPLRTPRTALSVYAPSPKLW